MPDCGRVGTSSNKEEKKEMVMKKILALITVLAGCTACAASDYHTTLIGKSLTELRQCAGASEGERKEGTLTVLDYSTISPRMTASRLPYAVPGLPLRGNGDTGERQGYGCSLSTRPRQRHQFLRHYFHGLLQVTATAGQPSSTFKIQSETAWLPYGDGD